MVKISSFNVNSINARLPNLINWLKSSNPDIVLLQEIKCLEENFPYQEILDSGYNSAVYGQKSYNGVAILSKYKIEDVTRGLTTLGKEEDQQARYIEGVIPINQDLVVRTASIYIPNGGGELKKDQKLEDSEKFKYKIDFFQHLRNHLARLLDFNEIQVFGGDFNVASEEIDCFDPSAGKILFHPQEREGFRRLLNLGLTDSFRATNPNQKSYSWWDYRGNSWQYDRGFRIDYLLTSPKASDIISTTLIEDKGIRDQDKASDHCPVSVII